MINDSTDTANLAPTMPMYCDRFCTLVLDVVADEEVCAVLPVLPRDVPLTVHGGQPHPHHHTVWVTVTIVVKDTLVIERTPGVKPPVPRGPGGHPLRVSETLDCISHSQSQSAAHKISRLGNLFLLLASDMRLG